ncbi:hypothetical protein HZA43_00540, partial [Candidatus Peregrinibacteria bacterium]|nr:hypothetical protein [Candidatus Peregrinibacteria bacterium]
MNIITKISRFIKRKIAYTIFFFITDNFDEFIGNSATLQNVQNLQHIVSEGVNEDRFKIKQHQSALQDTQKEVKQHQSALQDTQKEVKQHQSLLQDTQKEVKQHQ